MSKLIISLYFWWKMRKLKWTKKRKQDRAQYEKRYENRQGPDNL